MKKDVGHSCPLPARDRFTLVARKTTSLLEGGSRGPSRSDPHRLGRCLGRPDRAATCHRRQQRTLQTLRLVGVGLGWFGFFIGAFIMLMGPTARQEPPAPPPQREPTPSKEKPPPPNPDWYYGANLRLAARHRAEQQGKQSAEKPARRWGFANPFEISLGRLVLSLAALLVALIWIFPIGGGDEKSAVQTPTRQPVQPVHTGFASIPAGDVPPLPDRITYTLNPGYGNYLSPYARREIATVYHWYQSTYGLAPKLPTHIRFEPECPGSFGFGEYPGTTGFTDEATSVDICIRLDGSSRALLQSDDTRVVLAHEYFHALQTKRWLGRSARW